VLLVHREGEHARIGFEEERGAVAMMHVEVDHRRAFDAFAIALENADGDGDIVERTETLAVVGETRGAVHTREYSRRFVTAR